MGKKLLPPLRWWVYFLCLDIVGVTTANVIQHMVLHIDKQGTPEFVVAILIGIISSHASSCLTSRS